MKDALSNNEQRVRIRFVTDADLEYETNTEFSELTNWQPLYNLYVTSESTIIHLELAGVTEKEISVFLRSRYMIVTGTRILQQGITEDHCVFHNLEIPFGKFHRRIDFPMPIEPHEYQYDLRNGILTIQLRMMREKIITIEGE
ncbi:MAG: Hsp20/alpha crystallin family protein [candidate division WOR-3 bacterium]|nr:MAG: Hsp20/alpha crystallin family protein [candidate division WOR-3 bacterium]